MVSAAAEEEEEEEVDDEANNPSNSRFVVVNANLANIYLLLFMYCPSLIQFLRRIVCFPLFMET